MKMGQAYEIHADSRHEVVSENVVLKDNYWEGVGLQRTGEEGRTFRRRNFR